MYLVVIAWMYVVLMMAVAEATSPTGTLLGAIVTFLMYGVGPVALVVYLMGAPLRGRAIKRREAREHEHARASMQGQAPEPRTAGSDAPDAGGEPPADAVAPVREKT